MQGSSENRESPQSREDSERAELPGPAEQEELAAGLIRQARQLRAEIAECEAAEGDIRADCELDVADSGVRRGFEDQLLTQVNRARQELARTEGALTRLRDGSFGVCPHCSRPVGRERLLAMPTAELCVACQSQREGGDGTEG